MSNDNFGHLASMLARACRQFMTRRNNGEDNNNERQQINFLIWTITNIVYN